MHLPNVIFVCMILLFKVSGSRYGRSIYTSSQLQKDLYWHDRKVDGEAVSCKISSTHPVIIAYFKKPVSLFNDILSHYLQEKSLIF